jgi:hypothetical protein
MAALYAVAGLAAGLAIAAPFVLQARRAAAAACTMCGGTGRVVRLHPDSAPTPWRPGSYAEGVVQPCPVRHPKTRRVS